MELNNNDSIKIPEELQKRIEQVRNNLTLSEQETIRLNELKKKQESEIKENIEKILDTRNEIDNLENIKKGINEECDLLKKSADESFSYISKNRTELEKITKEISKKTSELEKRETNLERLENELSNRTSVILEKESNLDKMIESYNEKIDKINAFIKSL